MAKSFIFTWALFGIATLMIAPRLSQAASVGMKPKTVCYYEYWYHWNLDGNKMDVEDIVPSLCSHLVYASFGIDSVSHQIKLLDSYLMKDHHDLEKFVQIKGRSKAMITIDPTAAATEFPSLIANDQYLQTFIDSVIALLEQYNFDGIVIDWSRVPGQFGSEYVKLMKTFGQKLRDTPFSIGITIAEPENFDYSFIHFGEFIENIEFVNVLTFDYDEQYFRQDSHQLVQLAVDATAIDRQMATLLDYEKRRGIPRSKLVMGVPFYARTYRLLNATHHDVRDRASGPGTLAGLYTKKPGRLAYNELCKLVEASPQQFSIVRNPEAHTVHAIAWLGGDHAEFISFDDVKSLAYKAANISAEGFGGISVYALAFDDHQGWCGGGGSGTGQRYPLLRAIARAFSDSIRVIPTTTIPSVTIPTVSSWPSLIFRCPSEGKFRDSLYCFKYYHCVKGDFGAMEYTMEYCERHQYWDNEKQTCLLRTKAIDEALNC